MKKKLSLAVETKPQEAKYNVSESGTFREGELAIGKKGLLVGGQSPKDKLSTPKATDAKRKTSASPNFDQRMEPLLDLQFKDLNFIQVLGKGTSGIVHKAVHAPSGRLLAVKIITLELQEGVRKQIILELKTLHKTQCDQVVTFYDAFYNEGCIYVALEYMDAGSLADVLSKSKTVPENVLANIARQVLKGLRYLHKELHLIHRDIKPSNLLLNKYGEVKISDFGVSGQLAHTLSQAASWVGTVTYMSPERISGLSYSYDSDIWSVGLALVECALGRYPYRVGNKSVTSSVDQKGMGFWEVLEFIVKEPPPTLPPNQFSAEFTDFVQKTLQKTPEERPSATALLDHPWIKKYENDDSYIEWLQKWTS